MEDLSKCFPKSWLNLSIYKSEDEENVGILIIPTFHFFYEAFILFSMMAGPIYSLANISLFFPVFPTSTLVLSFY